MARIFKGLLNTTYMRKSLPIFLFIFIACIFVVPAFSEPEKAQIRALYKEGISLYKAGRLDEAKERFDAILEINPTYAPARSKMRLIQDKQERLLRRDKIITGKERILEVQRKWFPPAKKPEAGEEVPAAERFKTERQKIMEKKAQQVIPEINFTDAHLRDVLQYLSRISGINIVLDEDLFVRRPTGELGIPLEIEVTEKEEPEEGLTGEIEDLEWEEEGLEKVPAPVPTYTTIISDRVTITLRNIPLIEALKYILTAKGLKYRIDEYAIVVSTPQRLEQVEMETRYYHLTAGIGSFTEYVEPAEEAEEIFEWEEEEEEKPERLTIKDVLEQSGVPFPPGSKIFLDQRTGTLIVRNTPANLVVIEDILRALDVTPYQVEIEARFVQIRQEDAQELGLEWMVTSSAFRFGFNDDKTLRWDNATMDSSYGKYLSTTTETGKKGATRGLRYLTSADSEGVSTGTPIGSILSLSGILTDPQFHMVLHALNQSGNANLVSAPKVTTLNNQRAQIEMVEEFIYPDEYEVTPPTVRGIVRYAAEELDGTGTYYLTESSVSTNIITPGLAVPISFETRDIGIILNVIPSVGADRKTITLTLIPEISEFIDWIDYGIEEGVGWNKIPIRKPIFQTRNVTTSVVINDGETVVLGGLIKEDLKTSEDKIPLLGDIPLLGVLFRNKTKVSVKTNLVIFVTAKLLTPSGELIRETKEYVY